MAPMASSDTTPVARNTASSAWAADTLFARCARMSKLVLGCRMDI